MKKILFRNLSLFVFAAICSVFISACNGINKENPVNTAAQVATPNVKDESKGALRKRIEEIAADSQGKVGAAAVVLETGETVGLNENDRFPMQSVYKFPIAMAVLKQVEQGNLKLEQKIRIEKSDLVPKPLRSPIRDRFPQGTEMRLDEVLKYSVSDSDGTACDVLLKAVGGAAVVAKYLREIGVQDIVVATTEKEMSQDESVQYQNWASPKAANDLLRLLHEGRVLSEGNRALLLRWMTETPTGLKRLKGLLPAGTVVAHKTGTSGTFDGLTRATNDVGLVTLPNGKHLAISIFVSDSKADEKTREEVIAKITRAVWIDFVKGM
jgi:beta-lactamase class A